MPEKPIPPDEMPVDQIEQALLRRALGFRFYEEQTEEVFDKESGEPLATAKRRRVSKEVLPDVRALLFWLKNRRPDRWRDRVEERENDECPEFDERDSSL